MKFSLLNSSVLQITLPCYCFKLKFKKKKKNEKLDWATKN